MPARNRSNYADDFYAWTKEQAEHLREGRLDRLDVSNLTEEIETMGRTERAELESRLAVLLTHLLKWQHQPGLRSRSWKSTIREQRRQIERNLRRSPSLKAEFADSLAEAYGDAVLAAERETGLESFPASCPFGADQILDAEFLPG